MDELTRALIAEENALLRCRLVRALRRHNCQVWEAATIPEAWQCIGAAQPSLILLSGTLPEGDIAALAAASRHSPRCATA